MTRDTTDRNQFSQLLRYVYVDGQLINAKLVQEGWAEARSTDGNTRYATRLQTAATQASAARVGCYQYGGFGAPPAPTTPLPSSPTCCRRCSTGKPCGNSCISRRYNCHQPPGCACWADASDPFYTVTDWVAELYYPLPMVVPPVYITCELVTNS